MTVWYVPYHDRDEGYKCGIDFENVLIPVLIHTNLLIIIINSSELSNIQVGNAVFLSEVFFMMTLEKMQTFLVLAECRSFTEAVGTVEKVTVQDKAPQLKLGDQEVSLSAHPRVLNASVDPATWEGRSLEQSWLLTADGQNEQLHILVFALSSSTEAPNASLSASHS